MAVEKPMNPAQMDIEDADAVQVEVVNPEAVSVTTEDESMVIDFTGEMTEDLVGPNDANLAEYIEEADLRRWPLNLLKIVGWTGNPMIGRSYVKGLDLLGMKIEERTQPWAGAAAGVFHPAQQQLSAFRHSCVERFFLRLALSVQKLLESVTKTRLTKASVENETNYSIEEMTIS